jgi:hypothetical protein
MSTVLSVILIFLSPPEPLETHTLTPTQITMLAAVPTLGHTPTLSPVISSKGLETIFLDQMRQFDHDRTQTNVRSFLPPHAKSSATTSSNITSD